MVREQFPVIARRFKFGAASGLVLLCGTKREAPHIMRSKLCYCNFMRDLHLDSELNVLLTIKNSMRTCSCDCLALQVWYCYREPNLKHPYLEI